jgi:hypothetical protein
VSNGKYLPLMPDSLEQALESCRTTAQCHSVVRTIGEGPDGYDYILHKQGTVTQDASNDIYVKRTHCIPESPPPTSPPPPQPPPSPAPTSPLPSPPPNPPRAPPPTHSCADVAGRQNSHLLPTPLWCYQLRRSEYNCSAWYGLGSQELYNICYDPGDGMFCANSAGFTCEFLPPSPPAPPTNAYTDCFGAGIHDRRLYGTPIGDPGSLESAMHACVDAASTCTGVATLQASFAEADGAQPVFNAYANAAQFDQQGSTVYLLDTSEGCSHVPAPSPPPPRVPLSPSFPPPAKPPPLPPPLAPPSCSGGRSWRSNVVPNEATCADPVPSQLGFLVSRCACPVDDLFDEALGRCVTASSCPAASPKPPPPPDTPPPSPHPPLAPVHSPPPAPLCAPSQEEQNKLYCYDPGFSDAICNFDNGIHCPERCGKCRRAFASADRSHFVTLQLVLGLSIESVDQNTLKQRLADLLQISIAQIEFALSVGSTIVDATIVTVDGTASSAAVLVSRIETQLPSTEAATTALGVTVASTPVTGSSSSGPAAPPSSPPPRIPPRGPPAPPDAPGVSTPPHPPPPPPVEDESSIPTIAIIIGSAAGALLLLVIALVFFCLPNTATRDKYGRVGERNSFPPAAVVVYAGSAIDRKLA